jgi:thiamine biosynthesis protein ThiC
MKNTPYPFFTTKYRYALLQVPYSYFLLRRIFHTWNRCLHAAHAADIAKGVRGAREIDDRMADARREFDWEAQWECAINPDRAKAIRADREPKHEDTCSMCGKFCAIRSMNKALAGEHIDIL